MKQTLRNNGLSIVMFGLFAVFQIGMSIAGHFQYKQEQAEHGQRAVTYSEYLASSAFWEATSENWESEFLQMAGYVLFTAVLFQKGSAESKNIDEPEPVDRDPRESRGKSDAPWPVRRGGFVLVLYEHSLTLALFSLFIISFVIHVVAGAMHYSNEQIAHGGEAATAWEYLGTAQLWFELLQNWQSEFFSVGVIVVLSIFLRQRGSPESKPVDAPHSATGPESPRPKT
jgi:hypothetical protein